MGSFILHTYILNDPIPPLPRRLRPPYPTTLTRPTDLADIYAYNKSAEMVGQAFALQPGLREKFQIVYKVCFPLSCLLCARRPHHTL